MSKIQAVVFDVGGVLHESNTALDDDLNQELGISADALKTIWENELSLLSSGDIDEEEFWQRIHDTYGVRTVTVAENLLGRAFAAAIKAHAAIFDLVKELSANGMKLAILSNTIEPHAKALREAGIYDGFNYILLSHELGMRKPDHAIYQKLLEVLHVEPEATIFVDDKLKNVEAAEALGIHGIIYTEASEVIAKIQELIARGETER